MLWYRHFGHDQGYPIWHGALDVGTSWQDYDRIWIAGNGFVYAAGSTVSYGAGATMVS